MTEQQMKDRTRSFALRIIRSVAALSGTRPTKVIGDRLLRAGTSVGANYRAACRAGATRDFLAKMAIVAEEADETLYWMQLLIDAGLMKPRLVGDLMGEADEPVSIIVATIKTTRSRSQS